MLLTQAIEERSEYLDEALLSNAFAWMRKAADDKLDGMVALLQKVLQLYAARALSHSPVQNDDDAMLVDIISADDTEWIVIVMIPRRCSVSLSPKGVGGGQTEKNLSRRPKLDPP